MNWKLLLIISLVVFLSACAGNKTKPIEDVVIVTEYVAFDCGYSPVIDFVKFQMPVWNVVDGNFTLAPEEYAKLGENMTLIIKAIKQMVLKIGYYESCIASNLSLGEAAPEKENE